MSEVTINYKGSSIATLDVSSTKTLLTEGKYCEDDIVIEYTRPIIPPNGDNLEYGLIDATSSLVGVGKVGSMIIE